jgi:hypothetical protein
LGIVRQPSTQQALWFYSFSGHFSAVMTVLSYFFQIGALTYAIAWLGHKMVSYKTLCILILHTAGCIIRVYSNAEAAIVLKLA